MKGIALSVCLLAVLSVNPFAACAQTKGITQNLALSTASLGGTYYIVGAGIADILTKYIPGMKVSAIISQGSVGNPKMVDSGQS